LHWLMYFFRSSPFRWRSAACLLQTLDRSFLATAFLGAGAAAFFIFAVSPRMQASTNDLRSENFITFCLFACALQSLSRCCCGLGPSCAWAAMADRPRKPAATITIAFMGVLPGWRRAHHRSGTFASRVFSRRRRKSASQRRAERGAFTTNC